MNRKIKNVAILGSGIMGSRIACHFANIGVQVLLLDIAPKELTEKEKKLGAKLEDKAVRNRIVNDSLQEAIKSNPVPLYKKSFSKRITTGNFEDNMKDIAGCDWTIEVVIERLDIKKQVFENVEKHRTSGTLITTNTSGIPIHTMLEGRSEDFQKHFCGTHFFNPPRYLKLLEIIPTPKTDQSVTDFLMHYGDLFLGKTTVLCKDTPAFIANRIGVYGIMALFHLVEKMGLTVDEVDKLTGPVLGRPKSATFRTSDLVGLDTLVHVAKGVYDNCPDDEARDSFKLPGYLSKMVENKWLGSKTGQGFYKKVKGKDGKSEILSLDFKTLQYKPKQKVKFATLESTKPIEDLLERMKVLVAGKDKAGEFYKTSFYHLFEYVTNRIPEVADEIYKIDDAMKAGFGWELGPFEIWDALNVKETAEQMEQEGRKPAQWVKDMPGNGTASFYKVDNGVRKYYDIKSKDYKGIPGTDGFINLKFMPSDSVVWENSGATLYDIGDGIVNLEFHTKMNALGSELIEGINKSIEIAEKDFRGLVIANQETNFSVGANIALLLMYAIDQEFDEIRFMAKQFQKTIMKARYSSIPVVIAPHALVLGGACELVLHADKVQAAAETYIGLVEFGVGLIPAGGGTKELTLRASDSYEEGDIELNTLRNAYLTIGMAKVATSAHEAIDLNLLRKTDNISINRDRQIHDAKAAAIELAEAGYSQPMQRTDIKVQGRAGLGMFLTGADGMHRAKYISEHDKKISEKLAYVMCGGDLSAPTYVSEQYLLDLEIEAFLSLCGEKKTLERIQHMLRTGKPLRN
ncbi:MAG: 3-hydroxyacyl-CoA dehydrogenase/enoyl-CoA hydratase family protein [Bacteroidetes bacterium]|nr:3-hydroxyacyl-CoA dehydrogenase/enoyl-CoA hydratase family protein [Bacteroidota bacterium]